MPIFRVNGKVVFFAHIPKCGGGTIEHALQDSGLALSFMDTRFWSRDKKRWYRSSPQHLPSQQFNKLFSPNFFDYEFSVVRNPVTRFLSAFNHNRSRIGLHISFDRFLRSLERRQIMADDFFGYRFDNHFVPAARFVNDDTKIFFLEDGPENCLDEVSGKLGLELKPSGVQNARNYGFENAKKPIKTKLKKALFSPSPKVAELSDGQIERIRKLYAEDYERFPRYNS